MLATCDLPAFNSSCEYTKEEGEKILIENKTKSSLDFDIKVIYEESFLDCSGKIIGTNLAQGAFVDEEINEIRKNNPGIKIIAHPECPPDVIRASDFAGSTSSMIKYVKDNQPQKVMMVTECSMSDNVQIDNPKVEFIRPCNLCPHMKKITLPKILDCLENESGEIILDQKTLNKARLSVEKMVAIGG